MQAVIAATVFLTVTTLLRAAGAGKTADRVDVRGRLGQVIGYEEVVDQRAKELARPLPERLLLPLFTRIFRVMARVMPAGIMKSLEPKVARAANPGGLSANEFLGLKVMLALGIPAFAFVLAGMAPRPAALLVTAVLGWQLPDFYLSKKATERKNRIEKSFPDILDLLTVSVEAGLGFDGALAKVVEKDSGPVAAEFRRVLQEIKVGKSRKDALKDFAARCALEDITAFVNAMVQSEQLGLSVSRTLRSQSEQMRRKRRQRAEEQAMKAPVKMLIPLVVFIFPTIFIILLGPAVIQIIEGFLR